MLSQYQGKSWGSWASIQEELGGALETSSSSSSSSSLSTPSGMATPIHMPPSEDTMKLPKRDMKTFGLCPIQDELVLVVCEVCGKNVKMEAFHQHHRVRHGAAGTMAPAPASASTSASKSSKSRRNMRSCTVDLLKEDPVLLATSSSSSSTSVSASASSSASSSCASSVTNMATAPPSAAAVASLASSASSTTSLPEATVTTSLLRDNIVNKASSLPASTSSSAAVESRTSSLPLPPPAAAAPASSVTVSTSASSSSSSQFVSMPMAEGGDEADSTTANNVISIPDTNPLPHGMSDDLMAMVAGDLTAEDGGSSVDGVAASGAQGGSVGQQQMAPGGPSIQLMSPVINLQLSSAPSSGASTPQPPPVTPTTTPTPPGGKKVSPGKKGVAGGSGSKDLARKPPREYHPDRHCGVWDNESKRHCTRALTCKSHSVLLKRKITGRSKSFDDLVAAHKANKEAMAIAARIQATSSGASTPSPATTPTAILAQPAPPPLNTSAAVESVLNSIDQSRFQHPGAVKRSAPNWGPSPGQRSTPQSSFIATKANGAKRSLLSSNATGGREPDENLHYTTDHPKPLAVCTFGTRRVGGILLTDRSQFLTRKVVRVAITAGGFHRIRPQNRLNELRLNSNSLLAAPVVAQPPQPQPPQPPSLLQANPILKRASGPIQQQPQQQPRVAQVSALNVQAAPAPTAELIATPSGNKYVMNYSLQQPPQVAAPGTTATLLKRPGPTLLKTSHVVTPLNAGGVATSVAFSNIATPTPTVNLNAAAASAGGVGIPINIAAASDASFKTDIQDFKGGIQFELGRKMKPILPSAGNELAQ